MELQLKETLNRHGVLGLFERCLSKIEGTSDLAQKMRRLHILMKTAVEIRKNHIKHQDNYTKYIGLAIETFEKLKKLNARPPMIPPSGPSKIYLERRDEWAFEKGMLYSEALTYKGLAGDYEELKREAKDLEVIDKFLEDLNEKIMPLRTMLKGLFNDLKQKNPDWSDIQIFEYMKNRWGPVMEKAKKQGIIKFVAK